MTATRWPGGWSPSSALIAYVSAERYAEALIEIAAAFDCRISKTARCSHCGYLVTWRCRVDCPGLLARRALGVA